MTYKHGLYGARIASEEDITTAKNIPVYIGTAPMHRIQESSRAINKPIVVKSMNDAIRKTGYSDNDDFSKYTLSEAIYAHFENKIQSIGPIVLINVLDTSKAANKTDTITIIDGKAIVDAEVLIDAVDVANYVKDVDYSIEYTSEGKLQINMLVNSQSMPSDIDVTYKYIDPTSITSTEIIGTYNAKDETMTGIRAVGHVYEELNIVPTILSALKFNTDPKVRQALVSQTKQISDRWEAVAFTDIDTETTENIEDALKWRKDNGYNSNEEKTFWPKGIMGGREVHLSTQGIVAKMQTDVKYDNIPYQTPSNKQIDISGIKVKNGPIKLSQNRANELNASGITTAIYNGGKYVIWGPHMANYEDGVTSKPEEIFDVNVFMNKYLLNDFQLRNTDVIDQAMTRNDVESLIQSEQMILDSHVSNGRLLFGEITFNQKDNPVSDMIMGDFKFNTLVTNTPPSKSITQQVQYTSKGLVTAYSNEEEGED